MPLVVGKLTEVTRRSNKHCMPINI